MNERDRQCDDIDRCHREIVAIEAQIRFRASGS
jgi:hypothetical protein